MEPIAAVTGGQVRGSAKDGVTAYLGIPYAAAPLGADLYAAPQPVKPVGRRTGCDGAGCDRAAACRYDPPFNKLLSNPIIPGDEFLNVNVWTPGGSGLPVMVWFHGGAFRNGSNAAPAYDGTAFARDGVVLVSVNYRLGVIGFGVVAGAPSNRGLLDQLAALRWVQENIAAFGGDPSQVTIFGQSAGGMSVATLLSLPASQGLFRRAIMQSGSAEAVALRVTPALMTAEVAKRLGIEATPEALGAVPAADLIDAQREVSAELRAEPDPARLGASVVKAGGGIMPFFPVIDGELIHQLPLDAIAGGAAAGVELLTGIDAAKSSGSSSCRAGSRRQSLLRHCRYCLRRRVSIRRSRDVRRQPAGQSPGEIFAASTSAAFFEVPTIRLAEASRRRYGVRLRVRLAVAACRGSGACHALELPFVFDTLALDRSPLQGDNPPQELADRMHAAWVASPPPGIRAGRSTTQTRGLCSLSTTRSPGKWRIRTETSWPCYGSSDCTSSRGRPWVSCR